MKTKLLISLTIIVSSCLYSCDDSTQQQNVVWQPKSYVEVLSNTWVEDRPADGIWEKDRFTTTGVFYSTYTMSGTYNISENIQGIYSLQGNNILGTYRLSGGTQMSMDWTINEINELQITYTSNNTGLKFTSPRLLKDYEIDYGQTFTPDYKNLVPDTITIYKTPDNPEMGLPHIQGFSSHNTRIATVDAATGEITTISGGRTYIDVITNLGTACIEVNVASSIMGANWENYLWVDRETIYGAFGENPTSDLQKVMVYSMTSGNFQYLRFQFDLISGLVEGISLYPFDPATFTVEDIVEYLSKRFYVYEKGTTETIKRYINAQTADKASVGVSFYTDSKKIVYQWISHDLFDDYSTMLGKTRDEVESIMEESPFYSTDTSMAYMINSNYINYVSFYFNNGVTTNTVQDIWLAVNPESNKDSIIKYLEGKYTPIVTEYTSDTNKFYSTAEGFTIINYDMDLGYIIFTPNESNVKKRMPIHLSIPAKSNISKQKDIFKW